MSNIWLRLLAAAVGIPVLLSAAVYGGWWIMVVIVCLQLMLLWEWHRLSISIGTNVGPATLLFPVVGLDAFVFGHHGIMVEAVCIAALYVWVLSAVFRSARAPLRQLGFGALYLLWAALPLALWLPLTEMGDPVHHGTLGTLGILLAATWLCDSAAYFGGRSLGRHKLYPQASPNKTVEGAVFGVLGAAALLPVMSIFAFARPNLLDYIALPLIVGVGGQIGDLIESMIKREVDIKDSSTLIPGHGGFLDRFDSLLLSTPLYFAYLLFFRA